MMPSKRQRSTEDDEETEIIDAESASSSLQQASVRYQKFTGEQGLTEGQRKKPRTSYDDPEQLSSEDSADDDRFEEQATQYVSQQRNKKSMDNEAAENGIIETITCTNFMCHSFLEIQLGPLINFIIGHNGSGKSAVLTALTICLGGKAAATNRGGSLKSFIKEGEESSMLSVKIKNVGETAYQQDVYGDSIVVERHFSRSGSSSFKIKSSTGRLITTRKGDLEEICDYFALQIDNPMTVLTQDMARQFLNNSTPSDKYKFFMKGTQLEHLDGDYLIVEQNVEVIDQDLWKKHEDLKVFREAMEKANNRAELSRKSNALRDTIENLAQQMAWTQVEEQERILEGYVRKITRNDEKIEALEMTAAGLSEAFTQTEQPSEHANSVLEETKAALVPLQEEKARVKAEHDRYKAEQLALHVEQRAIGDEIKATKARIKKAEDDIAAEHQRLSDVDGGGHALRRAEIEEKRAEASAAKARLRDHENELPALEDNKFRAERELKDSYEPVKRQRAAVQESEGRLNALVRDRGQQQQAYPPNMTRLLAAIRQDDGFQQKPTGPMGNHVRLLKPLWSSILEKSFGGALEAFVVTSKEDQFRLSAIMQRVGCSFQILITNNNPIDTTGKEPAERFETSLRALEIDNALVKKQLIINQGVDQTVLIRDRSKAIDEMNDSRLQNVRQCYALNERSGDGIRLAYGYGGGLSQSHQPGFKGTPRMKTDIEYQINSQREALIGLKTELNKLEQTVREKQNNLKVCEQAIVKQIQEIGYRRIDVQQADTLVDELQDALDADAIEEGRLDVLKEQLAEAKEDQATHEASYGEFVIARDKNNDSMRTTRDGMAEMDTNIEEAEAKVAKAESKATRCGEQRAAALREKNVAIDAVEKEKRDREMYKKEREDQVAAVESFTSQANEHCARVRVDEGETPESIERKYDKLRRDLARADKQVGGNLDDIARVLERTVEAYDKARREVESLEELTQLLKETLINRRDRWRKFQKHITSRARIQFFYLLSERGFRGKLLANHKEKKLDLLVEPDETRRSAKGNTTKGLSGGEKSFSTICLLLSMWEAMGAPIRCLDEFDVFMDSVNREISMEMMIKFARGSRGKQFILITPQSMSKVSPKDHDVKVNKMRDPERGQTQLSFPPA